MIDTQDISLPFYNMQAGILFQGIIIDEVIAVKNFWEKNGGIILDIYIYSSKQSKIIDAAYIKTLKNLNNGREYKDIYEFVEDFKSELEKSFTPQEKTKSGFDFTYLRDLEQDLVVLGFLSNLTKDYRDIKMKVIGDFIRKHKPKADMLSEQYISAYLDSLEVAEDDFYEALTNMSYKSIDSATELLREAIKICAVDGIISYDEKRYIAEILQTFRDHNVEPEIEF